MNENLKYDIENFDKNMLINRIEYPEKIRNWVYKNSKTKEEMFYLSAYICHSAGYHYVEKGNNWVIEEIKNVCSGCKRETTQFVCSKMFKRCFCFDCWFDCNKKFI